MLAVDFMGTYFLPALSAAFFLGILALVAYVNLGDWRAARHGRRRPDFSPAGLLRRHRWAKETRRPLT